MYPDLPGVGFQPIVEASSRSARVRLFYRLLLRVSELHGLHLSHGSLELSALRLLPEGSIHLGRILPLSLPGLSPQDEVPAFAPEVLAGGSPSLRADVYALGLLGFRFFLQRELLPPAPLARMEENQHRLFDHLGRHDLLEGRAPAKVSELFRQCLDPDPRARPDNASVLLEELSKVVPVPKLQPGEIRAWSERARGEFHQELLRTLGRPLSWSLEVVEDLFHQVRLVERAKQIDVAPALARSLGTDLTGLGFRILEETDALSLDRRLALELYETLCQAARRPKLGYFARTQARKESLLRADQALPPDFGRGEREGLEFVLAKDPWDQEILLSLMASLPEDPPPRDQLEAIRHRVFTRLGLDLPLVIEDLRQFHSKGEELDMDRIRDLLLRLERDPETLSFPPRPDEDSSPETQSLIQVFDSALLEEPGFASKERFQMGKDLVQERDFDGAAQLFLELAQEGYFKDSGPLQELRDEVETLLWQALVGNSHRPHQGLLERIWRLVDLLGFEALEVLSCQLLLQAVPETIRAKVIPKLLERDPNSLVLLAAAARAELEAEAPQAWAEYLRRAAEQFVQRRDLVEATRLLRAAQTVSGDRAYPELEERILILAQIVAETSSAFRVQSEALAEVTDPGSRARVWDRFLEQYPGFVPAEQALAKTARESGWVDGLNRALLGWARTAILKHQPEEAIGYLAQVLEVEYDNGEALLLLAGLAPPPEEPVASVVELKIQCLVQVGLYRPALHQIRKSLRGDEGDLRLYDRMCELYQALGGDPSFARVNQADLLFHLGSVDKGSAALKEALEAAGDPEAIRNYARQFPRLVAAVAGGLGSSPGV